MRSILLFVLCATLAVLLLLPATAGAVGYVYQDGWGGSGAGLGQFSTPEGLAVDGHGAVYVTEYGNDRLQKFTTDGVFVGWVGGSGAALGQFNKPSAALVDSTGKLLVGEYDGGRVQVLTSGLTPLSAWGTSGTGTNQFRGINQIVEDSAGNIYVTEYMNNRVQKFDSAHIYLANWAAPGASGIAIDEHGTVYVASWDNGTISRFDTSGNPVVGPPIGNGPGTAPGQLTNPSNMAFGPDGALLVGEAWPSGRISRFNPDTGNFLGLVASNGTDPGQVRDVWGLAVDGDSLFATDRMQSHMVKKWVWDDTAPVLSHTTTTVNGTASRSRSTSRRRRLHRGPVAALEQRRRRARGPTAARSRSPPTRRRTPGTASIRA